MVEQQLWALIAFVVLIIGLALVLPTSRPKLDGRQKYRARRAPLLGDNSQRTSITPLAAALAVLFGGSSGIEGRSHIDAGSDNSGGDNGGDSQGDGGGGGE